MRYAHGMLRRLVSYALACALIAACAVGSDSKTPATKTTPADGDAHPAGWYTVPAARLDYESSAKAVDNAMSNCQEACKALQSLERAANHLCAVAEPEECSDARQRFDRARRAVQQQCGGC